MPYFAINLQVHILRTYLVMKTTRNNGFDETFFKKDNLYSNSVLLDTNIVFDVVNPLKPVMGHI